MELQFFTTAETFRKWLEKNHKTAAEIRVGFYKAGSGRPSITWPQSVEEALCFGWIDGVRTSVDEESYQIRFTPRKPDSIWSAVNIRKIQELTEQGKVQPAGLACFENRNREKAGLYSYENEEKVLPPDFEKQFKANKAAWTYFQALAPSYRKTSLNWVTGARQEATRLKRLRQLIADSEAGINQWKDNKYKK